MTSDLSIKIHFLMALSNGRIFGVTVPLWWESTSDRWFLLAKISDAELCCFFLSAPKQSRPRWLETPPRSLWRYNVLYYFCRKLGIQLCHLPHFPQRILVLKNISVLNVGCIVWQSTDCFRKKEDEYGHLVRLQIWIKLTRFLNISWAQTLHTMSASWVTFLNIFTARGIV